MNSSTDKINSGATAYSYIRFSRTIQKQGRSRLRQKEAYEAWCAKNNVIPSDDTFLDEGKSGYTGDHVGPKGQLRRFLDRIEDGTIPKGSYLVVESLDRLGRESVNLALERFLGILNAGVNIITLMDNEKEYRAGATPPADLIMSVLVMARANEESKTKAERSEDNWATAFRLARTEKKPVGKQVAFWLDTVKAEGLDWKGKPNKKYVPNEHAKTIKRIFDMCIAGHGFVVTAKTLNAEGAGTRRAKSWGASSVRDVLENKCVLGEWEPKDGGGVIEGYFPQIITPTKWELAQAAKVKRVKGDYTRQASDFQIWNQVGYCAVCGASVNRLTKGRGKYQYRYITCSRKRRGLCEESKGVRSEQSELVFKEILVNVGALGLIQTGAAEITDAMAAVDASLHKQETLLARHMQAASELDASPMIYKLIGSTEAEIARLKAERADLERQHTAQTVAQSDKAWLMDNLPLVERDDRQRANALLGRLAVTVTIKGGDIPIFSVYQKERLIMKIRVVDGKPEVSSYSSDVTMRMFDQGELEEHQLELNVGFGSKTLPKMTDSNAVKKPVADAGQGWTAYDETLPEEAYELLGITGFGDDAVLHDTPLHALDD